MIVIAQCCGGIKKQRFHHVLHYRNRLLRTMSYLTQAFVMTSQTNECHLSVKSDHDTVMYFLRLGRSALGRNVGNGHIIHECRRRMVKDFLNICRLPLRIPNLF